MMPVAYRAVAQLVSSKILSHSVGSIGSESGIQAHLGPILAPSRDRCTQWTEVDHVENRSFALHQACSVRANMEQRTGARLPGPGMSRPPGIWPFGPGLCTKNATRVRRVEGALDDPGGIGRALVAG